MNKSQAAKDILKKQDITSWFQPIIDIDAKELVGWEAFSRAPSISPFQDTPSLFDSAAEAGVLKPLDLMCLHNAAQCFDQLQLENKLFINLSTEIILASGKLKTQIGELIRDSSVPPTQMVLEIDARSASTNVQALFSATEYFQKLGFDIAINDRGASGASQYLWAEIKPSYVKIDRNYVQNLQTDTQKQEQIKDIVAASRSLGAKVIAKGVESHEELSALQALGVNIMQGYFIQRPELSPLPPKLDQISQTVSHDGNGLACDLAIFHDKVESSASVGDVLTYFEENISVGSVAVLENDKAIGMVFRTPFLAKLSSKQRRSVLEGKRITEEMELDFLNADAHLRLEQVSRMVTTRARFHAEQDYVISNQEKFLGIGTVVDLLKKITHAKSSSSEGLNVLSMLPGNVPLAARVDELLSKGTDFSAVLLDLTNFKPFNNHYGYTKGDELLVMFAELLRKHVNNESDFAGHLGGDDFLLISKSHNWQQLFASLLHEFSTRANAFYSKQDIQQGGIQTTDRLGEERFYSFVSISSGALRIGDEYYDSFQSVLTRIIQLKQKTRKQESLCAAYEHNSEITYYSYDQASMTLNPVESA